jgi:protein-L-isoaspartate(D-aspartate) O-methyltransferase
VTLERGVREGGSPLTFPESQPARDRMVAEQITARGVNDPKTLAALRKVPRHLFVPAPFMRQAYEDHPLALAQGQTISQPYIVAFMTAALGLTGDATVLEVGTGSGYQTAVLAEIAGRVYSLEILGALADEARDRLRQLGYRNVDLRAGDGEAGWPEAAPFDAIVVTAAAPHVPEALVTQLRDGGRLVVPVGEENQELVLVTRNGASLDQKRILPVRFVPMTGKIRDPSPARG